MDEQGGLLFETIGGKEAIVSLHGCIHGASQTRGRPADCSIRGKPQGN